MIARVIATPAATPLIRRSPEENGPLVVHHSGGCCEGSAPMCFRQRDFRLGARDVLPGVIEACPFYVGGTEFDYWAAFELTIDVTRGGGGSFSIEATEGVRFVTCSRLFTGAEMALMDMAGPPPRGPEAIRPGDA
jgi:uncharacterized protein (DUF779 family)